MNHWEARYQAGDIPWEKGQAAPPLLEMIERPGISDIWGSGIVLVPGSGAGHDVRALAEKGLEVMGLDLAPSAVKLARSFPRVGSETYEVGDFLDLSWREGLSFSSIWEHTCFCAIDPARRDDYAAAAAGVLAPGSVLAGVFYLTPNDAGEENCGPPFNVSIAELDQHFAPWFERIDSWVPQRTYPGREGREWIGIYRKLG